MLTLNRCLHYIDITPSPSSNFTFQLGIFRCDHFYENEKYTRLIQIFKYRIIMLPGKDRKFDNLPNEGISIFYLNSDKVQSSKQFLCKPLKPFLKVSNHLQRYQIVCFISSLLLLKIKFLINVISNQLIEYHWSNKIFLK